MNTWTNTSQDRAERLQAAGYEVVISPMSGAWVRNAPYQTGDSGYVRDEPPAESFPYPAEANRYIAGGSDEGL